MIKSKQLTTSIALFLLLCPTFNSCEKDLESHLSPAIQYQSASLCYSVDGIFHTVTVSEEDLHYFYLRLVDLARNGHKITIQGSTTTDNPVAGKEIVTYRTSNRADAAKWAEEMKGKGYDVSIEYDNESGMYNCTAVK